jgi:hypothetical protein
MRDFMRGFEMVLALALVGFIVTLGAAGFLAWHLLRALMFYVGML